LSLDLTLLRVLKYRDRLLRLLRSVPAHVLDPLTKTLLADMQQFFIAHPDVERLPQAEFFTLFKLNHPTLTPEQTATYEHLLKQVQEDVPPELEATLMERLVAADVAYETAAILQRWNQGDEVELYAALREQVERYESETNRKVVVPWVTTTIADLLSEEANDTGLHWRLDCLNLSMRPLRGGDFGIVAARVDQGKTSFLTSELTFMAPQIARMYNNERSIIWLNNEGPGKRIIQRCYQSALDLTVPELVERVQQKATKPGFNHLLDQQYAEAMGGRIDMIKVMDIHDFQSHHVEDIIRKVPAGLVVWDMIDNVRFSGASANGGERTDQMLEAMYQWVRVLSVKYDIPMLATSQSSVDAAGLQFPLLHMLKDSKTGKQGAAEFQLMIGSSNDPGLAASRFLGLPKNKLHRSGGPKDPRCEVIFDGERGRYRMPSYT
jgi:replicative DNA helicase